MGKIKMKKKLLLVSFCWMTFLYNELGVTVTAEANAYKILITIF